MPCQGWEEVVVGFSFIDAEPKTISDSTYVSSDSLLNGEALFLRYGDGS